MMNGDRLAVLDLYERYRDGEMFLTGAFGGVKTFIHPIEGADPDDRCWRLYFAPRVQGVDKDRSRPTKITRPAPTGWAGVHAAEHDQDAGSGRHGRALLSGRAGAGRR